MAKNYNFSVRDDLISGYFATSVIGVGDLANECGLARQSVGRVSPFEDKPRLEGTVALKDSHLGDT